MSCLSPYEPLVQLLLGLAAFLARHGPAAALNELAGPVAKAVELDLKSWDFSAMAPSSLAGSGLSKGMAGYFGGRPGVAKKAPLAELLKRIEEETQR